MTRLEALELLFASSSHDRFKAARALEKTAEPEDLVVLRRAKHLETDAYVIKRLEIVIRRCSKTVEVVGERDVVAEDLEEIVRTQRAVAVEWIAGLLLHEIGVKIGLIELSARKEIERYEESKTRKNITNLQEIFEGISHLKKAASTPLTEEFSLATLLDEVIAFEETDKNLNVSRVGERPAMVFGDSRLVRLAVCNGIRNAMEAVQGNVRPSSDIDNSPQVVVSWGVTDTDYWVSVIDRGPGILDSERFFSVGSTTKLGHLGFGLAVAKQAVESMQGVIRLYSPDTGGTVYEVRWEK